MEPAIQKEAMADADVQKHILAEGWRNVVMRYLKEIRNGDDGEEGMATIQADFWPESLRETIVDIDRVRVFVPSRMEYVSLMPDAISKREIREAGEHLIKKGEECIRIGKLLIQLSDKL
jgi:hypothetical protein